MGETRGKAQTVVVFLLVSVVGSFAQRPDDPKTALPPVASTVGQRLADVIVPSRATSSIAAYDPPQGNLSLLTEGLSLVTGVPMGFEAIPESPDQRPGSVAASPSRRVPLAGLRLGAALDEIVRIDPRYQWSEAAGIINIRPRRAAGDPEDSLNRVVPAFRMEDVTLGGAAVAIQRVFDPTWRPPADSTWLNPAGPNAPAGAPAAGPADPRLAKFSMSLEHATVLQILNAVAVAHGSVGWRVEFDGPRPEWPVSRLVFPSTQTGIKLATSARPSPGSLATSARPSPGSSTVQPAGYGPSVVLELPPTPERLQAVFRRLALSKVLRVGLRLWPGPFPVDRAGPPGEWRADLTGLPADAALQQILSLAPGYERIDDGDIVNILPIGARGNPDDVLNRRVRRFEVKDATFDDVIDGIRGIFNFPRPARRPVAPRLAPPANPMLTEAQRRLVEVQNREREAERDRKITLSLRDTTLRHVLNAIMAQRDDVTWTVALVGDRPDTLALQIVLAARWSTVSVTIAPGRW